MTQIPPISPTTFTVILILLAIKNSENDAYLEIIWTIPLSSSYQGSTFLIFSLCLNFFHLLALKPNLEEKKTFIQTNSFIIFTCPNPVLLVPGFTQVG